MVKMLWRIWEEETGKIAGETTCGTESNWC